MSNKPTFSTREAWEAWEALKIDFDPPIGFFKSTLAYRKKYLAYREARDTFRSRSYFKIIMFIIEAPKVMFTGRHYVHWEGCGRVVELSRSRV